MANKLLRRFLSLSFISFCLLTGIGIDSFLRFGQSQAADGTAIPTKPIPDLYTFPDSTSPPVIEEPNFSDTITIQAVGDVIPGTNYPNNRLLGDKNLLIPKSVRAYLQRADLLFGNLETSLTTYPYSSKDINKGQIFAFRFSTSIRSVIR